MELSLNYKRIQKIILMSLMIIVILVGCQSKIPETGRIVGTVIFPQVPELVVQPQLFSGHDQTQVYLDNDRYTISAVDGKFVFENVPVGWHTLSIKDAYYRSFEVRVNVTAKGDTLVTMQALLDKFFRYLKYSRDESTEETVSLMMELWENYPGATTLEIELEGLVEPVTIPLQEGYSNLFIYEYKMRPITPLQTGTMKKTYRNTTGEVIDTVTKLLEFPRLVVYPVQITAEGQTMFSWEPLEEEGVLYQVVINQGFYEVGKFSTFQTSHSFTKVLPAGEYTWTLKAHRFDKIGRFDLIIVGSEQPFQIP